MFHVLQMDFNHSEMFVVKVTTFPKLYFVTQKNERAVSAKL